MLIRNDSRVNYSIDIKLLFDDNSTKELTIKESDYIHITYRKNGCIKCGIGTITRINPYFRTRWDKCNTKSSAIITVDMSKENDACIEQIELYNILDVYILDKENLKCPCTKRLENEQASTEEVIES